MKRTQVFRKHVKIAHLLVGIILTIITMFFVLNFYTGITYAVELNGNESGIMVDQSELFNIQNLYPGQPPVEAKQPLKIKNTGGSEFECTISSILTKGDMRLFNILKLNINDEEGKSVYYGNLKDLNQFPLGKIGPKSSKIYNFILELPIDVDNSYQALSTSFGFEVVASDLI